MSVQRAWSDRNKTGTVQIMVASTGALIEMGEDDPEDGRARVKFSACLWYLGFKWKELCISVMNVMWFFVVMCVVVV